MPDLATPATLEDVRGSIERPLTSEEERVIPAWIEQAWIVLRYASPGLEARVVAGSLRVEPVQQVLVAMVERKLRNPEGLRAYNVDDTTTTIDAALSSGQLAPTPDELARLAPPAVARGGIFSIQLGRG
jgi:hypothetical protein